MSALWEPVSGAFWSTAPFLPSMGWSVDYGALFTTLVGALAGAGIGAWTAGWISEKNRVRELLTKEIRDTNAAIVLTLGVMSDGVSLKKNHVTPLAEDYFAKRKKCEETMAQMALGHPQTEFPRINLLEFPEIAPPIFHLQEIVLSRLSTAGRALACVTTLNDAVININTALKRRNDLIIKFKNNDFPPGATREHFCFGIRYGKGETNEEYQDSIMGISFYTDDVIFFFFFLCTDLVAHGELLVKRFKKRRLGVPTPEIHTVELSGLRKEGWIPDAAKYEDWTSGFQTSKKEKQRWWKFTWCKQGE